MKQDLAYRAKTGDLVAGQHCGFPFRGAVTAVRFDTMNNETILVSVRLESPIEIFGAIRESIQVGYNASQKTAQTTYIDTISFET